MGSRLYILIQSAFFFPLSLVNIVRFSIQGMGFSPFAILAGVLEMARGLEHNGPDGGDGVLQSHRDAHGAQHPAGVEVQPSLLLCQAPPAPSTSL